MDRRMFLGASAGALGVAAYGAVAGEAAWAAAVKPTLGQHGLDLTARDASVKPGDDFFRYVNGTWL